MFDHVIFPPSEASPRPTCAAAAAPGELPAWSGASLVSGEHHLGEPDEGVPLRRRPQQADVPDGFLAVALGQVVGLFHAVALQQEVECEPEVRLQTACRVPIGRTWRTYSQARSTSPLELNRLMIMAWSSGNCKSRELQEPVTSDGCRFESHLLTGKKDRPGGQAQSEVGGRGLPQPIGS